MKKILVVDDSQSIRNEVSEALAPAGYCIVEAANSTEVFAQLSVHADVKMILLDVNMPGMSGLDVLEHLQRKNPTHNYAVLMLTTEAERTLVDRAKRAGAKGWLLKPVKPELLRSAAARFVG
jgi:two-component system, chemotaxis family, chemotaxis protein CheY